MAEIKILTIKRSMGGPEELCDFEVCIKQDHVHRKLLQIAIGGDYVEFWPADPDKIKEFGYKLIKISQELRKKAPK